MLLGLGMTSRPTVTLVSEPLRQEIENISCSSGSQPGAVYLPCHTHSRVLALSPSVQGAREGVAGLSHWATLESRNHVTHAQEFRALQPRAWDQLRREAGQRQAPSSPSPALPETGRRSPVHAGQQGRGDRTAQILRRGRHRCWAGGGWDHGDTCPGPGGDLERFINPLSLLKFQHCRHFQPHLPFPVVTCAGRSQDE